MPAPGAHEGPALLASLRDRLLGQLLGLLAADPAVAGVALVGSLGRGEEDNWSDIDLFILASGQFIRLERRPVKAGTLPFGEFNASGPRPLATAKTADEVRQLHLGYVPTAGKYVNARTGYHRGLAAAQRLEGPRAYSVVARAQPGVLRRA